MGVCWHTDGLPCNQQCLVSCGKSLSHQVETTLSEILRRGKVFGQVNTKWAYIVSVVIFEVGSALCGAAPNMNALIVARVLQGMIFCPQSI